MLLYCVWATVEGIQKYRYNGPHVRWSRTVARSATTFGATQNRCRLARSQRRRKRGRTGWPRFHALVATVPGNSRHLKSSSQKIYLWCQTHLDTSFSRTWTDSTSLGCHNRCTCVHATEEGDDGEGAGSETPSLLSYTLRYVSLSDLVRLSDVSVCMRERGGWGRGGTGGGWRRVKCTIVNRSCRIHRVSSWFIFSIIKKGESRR
jgi:hypothetical protein